jgi:hypothetical protein
MIRRNITLIVLMAMIVCAGHITWAADAEQAIDMDRAKQLFQRQKKGEQLSGEEQAYIDKARAARSQRQAGSDGKGLKKAERSGKASVEGKTSTGIKPLCEMTAVESYKSEDGGLYGNGTNTPTAKLQAAATKQLAKIRPLNKQGEPADNGQIVLLSIGMSNTTQEFSAFKQAIDADPRKSEQVVLVDGAQGGQSASEWTVNHAERTWAQLDQRLSVAGVSSNQVQALWLKQAEIKPLPDAMENARLLQRHLVEILNRAKSRFPNLQIAYLSSRTYGGYSARHPEPESFATAFSVRWVIKDQLEGKPELCWDSDVGAVKAPLVLWGPYLWADGTNPRQQDGLKWERSDFVADGTHPSSQGKAKVVKMLTEFFTTDPNAKGWFLKK